MKDELQLEAVPIKIFLFEQCKSTQLKSLERKKDNRYSSFRNFLLLRSHGKNNKPIKEAKIIGQHNKKHDESSKIRPSTGITRKSNSTDQSENRYCKTYYSKKFSDQNPQLIKNNSELILKQSFAFKNYFPQRKSLTTKDFRWQKYYFSSNKLQHQKGQYKEPKPYFGERSRIKTTPTPSKMAIRSKMTTASKYSFYLHKKPENLKRQRTSSNEQVCPWSNLCQLAQCNNQGDVVQFRDK